MSQLSSAGLFPFDMYFLVKHFLVWIKLQNIFQYITSVFGFGPTYEIWIMLNTKRRICGPVEMAIVLGLDIMPRFHSRECREE